MDQIFADIIAIDLVLARLFEFVSDYRWIALLHHDGHLDIAAPTAEVRVRFFIFDQFSDSLRTLYRMLTALQRLNIYLFSILQAQLRENDVFLQFRLFQALNFALWEPINRTGFHATVHHPMATYQRLSANIRMHATEIQEFCNVFSTQLDEALVFYNTEVFVENTVGAQLAVNSSLRFSDMRAVENARYRLASRRQEAFYLETTRILRSFHGR